MNRRHFLRTTCAGMAIVCLPSLLRAAPPSASAISLPAAINKAGRQRMLTQRMTKAWLMLGSNLLPERAQGILQQSMSLFQTQLSELSTLTPSDEVRNTLSNLKNEWHGFRPMLLAAPSADSAGRLFDANEKVLAKAHALTLAYERVAASPAGRLVNLAGRQRMLSQRMAKFYLFRHFGVSPAADQAEIEKARREFTLAHEALLAAPETTASIRAELALVDQQWMFFQNALDQADGTDHQRAATAVATTSERILEQMDVAVRLYERLA